MAKLFVVLEVPDGDPAEALSEITAQRWAESIVHDWNWDAADHQKVSLVRARWSPWQDTE